MTIVTNQMQIWPIIARERPSFQCMNHVFKSESLELEVVSPRYKKYLEYQNIPERQSTRRQTQKQTENRVGGKHEVMGRPLADAL